MKRSASAYEIRGRLRHGVVLQDAAVAKPFGADEPRAPPVACELLALLPRHDAIGAVVDHQRLRAQAGCEARELEIGPAQAVALLDRSLHGITHRLGNPVPAGEAARVAEQVRGRAD